MLLGSNAHPPQVSSTTDLVAAMDRAAISIGRSQLDLLGHVADFDARDGWRSSGHPSTARWLSARFGLSHFKAQRMVACAKVISSLPRIREALAEGVLDLDRVTELTRMAGPGNEAELISWARRVTPQTIRARADEHRAKAAREAKRNHGQRYLVWDVDDFESVVYLNARLPLAEGLKVTGALERISKTLPVDPDDPCVDQRRADALVHACDTYLADHNDPERPTVVVHTTLDKLVSKTQCSEIDRGLALHPNFARALCCDSRIQMVIRDPDGSIRAVGDPHYVVPARLRRVVLQRDGHRCTFPGCHVYMTDVHHIIPWPRGATEEPNLVTVCRFHHNLIHVHSWMVVLRRGVAVWFRPNGDRYDPRPVRGSPISAG